MKEFVLGYEIFWAKMTRLLMLYTEEVNANVCHDLMQNHLSLLLMYKKFYSSHCFFFFIFFFFLFFFFKSNIFTFPHITNEDKLCRNL